MDPKADYIKKALESEFIENLSLEDMREAVKGRTDFRECVYDDHTIFVYFLGMGTFIVHVSLHCTSKGYLSRSTKSTRSIHCISLETSS